LRNIKKRLELIRRHPQLRVGTRRQGARDLVREDARPMIRAIAKVGYSRGDARFIWLAYWTTSPAVAKELAGHGSWRTLARFMDASLVSVDARRIQAGLRCVKRLGFGCLWGRRGREARPGTRGHRFVEGVLERRSLAAGRHPKKA